MPGWDKVASCIGLNFPVLLQTSPRLTHEPRGIYYRAEVSLSRNMPIRESMYRIPRLTGKNKKRRRKKEACISVWGKAGLDSPVYTVIHLEHWRSWGTQHASESPKTRLNVPQKDEKLEGCKLTSLLLSPYATPSPISVPCESHVGHTKSPEA